MIEDLFTPQHLIILFVILFFLFGAKKLPDLGKSLGHGIREFRSGVSGLTDESPAGALTPADDQAVVAAGTTEVEAGTTDVEAGTAEVAPETIVAEAATPATAEASASAADASAPATAEPSAAATDPALDDAGIEDADYTELDGDVTSEVVGEMSAAEGAVATPGPQA